MRPRLKVIFLILIKMKALYLLQIQLVANSSTQVGGSIEFFGVDSKINSINPSNKTKMRINRMFSVFAMILLAVSLISSAHSSVAQGQTTLYDFTVTDIYGDEFNFADLKGKKVMIVNTASKCGLTPQYESLEKLYTTYGDEDFVIVGFPANNFMNQEPGSNEDIISFCEENYGVTFPMMSKISVKGDDMHPLYQWLTQKEKNGFEDSEVSWNFQKYLIDENGHLVAYYAPRKDPLSKEIVSWISE